MEKSKKKNIRRIIALMCMVAVVALLAAMPLLEKQDPQEDGPRASILSGTVSAGSINTELIGGGTLSEDDSVVISVPSAVKLKAFLVSNGDTVAEGTPIASVDRVTVMTAISQVQETLEYLSEQIEEASDTDSEETVTALAGGIVKILYAEEGESVQSVMLEHGALAVLSLDGLMAVDLEVESDLSVDASVIVTLSDGTAAEGKISRNLAGEMTVTVEDDGYPVDDEVSITTADGTAIGSGPLYIYSPWNATAYTGTIDSIKVSVGDKLSAGKALMVLSEVGSSAAYRQLIAQRQEYEELMLELFQMYQTETVTAPCDGVVSGIDPNSLQLLSAGEDCFTITFLANAPNGDDETLYANYAGQVMGIYAEGWGLNIDPQPIPIDDYMILSGIPLDTKLMTQPVLHTRTDIPIYTLTDGAWVQVNNTEISVGDILLFAADGEGGLVWCVLMQKATQPDTPADPTEPGDIPPTTEPGSPANPSGPTAPSDPSGSAQPGSTTNPNTPDFNVPSGGGSFPSGGNWAGSSGMTPQEPAFELYDLEKTQIAAVTPQDTMTLEITIDELDINSLLVGMAAEVKIDALGGEKYEATITQISNTGTSNGGNSKYPVTLTLERTGNMLSGMNATATIVLTTADDVLTLPADALVEKGNQTVVYTGYDEESETLLNPVTVTIGYSDGETVEILEGLAAGQTYYYAYYDTLEISFTPDFGGGGFMFR